MDENILKFIYDALEACKRINRFVKQRSFEDYNQDEYLRSAVERQFEIVGEALTRIRKIDDEISDSIEGFREAISFRNILAHGYDSVDNVIVWSIIENDLSKLIESLEKIIR